MHHSLFRFYLILFHNFNNILTAIFRINCSIAKFIRFQKRDLLIVITTATAVSVSEMGNSKSSATTPRSIQIKVHSITGTSKGNASNSEQTDDVIPTKDSDEGSRRSKSRGVVTTIQEEQNDNLVDPIVDKAQPLTSDSKTEVLCRDFDSRNESVAKEIRLLSVTPSYSLTPCGGRASRKYRKNSDIIMLSTSPEEDRQIHHEAITPEIADNEHEEQLENPCTVLNDDANIDHNGNPRETEITSLSDVTVLFEKHWSGSSPSDVMPCWIHGMTALADGCVLLLDLNNNALKLFDENQTFVHSVSVSEECIGISSVYSNEVAITCGNEIVFYFVDKTSFVLQQRCFKLNGQGFGICFSHKNYAVTCDIHKTNGTVRILNERGKQRYVIKSCKVFGNVLKMSKFVQIHPTLDVVYISDAQNGRIVSFTFDGRALWHCDVSQEPTSIISIHGNLLLADFRGHQIIQVSIDGRESRVLLTDENEIWSPDYVTYNSKTKQLFINSPENVLVFKLL